jgi:hypothetical protein
MDSDSDTSNNENMVVFMKVMNMIGWFISDESFR